MRFKPFYLYLAGFIIALIVFGCELIIYHQSLDAMEIIISIVPALILGYLAFKVYHETDDEELM